jgi:hypothetical protein
LAEWLWHSTDMQVLRAKIRSVGVCCILWNILQIRGYAPINNPSRDAKYQAASEASMQPVPGEEDKGKWSHSGCSR